jgi:hypothetical protein
MGRIPLARAFMPGDRPEINFWASKCAPSMGLRGRRPHQCNSSIFNTDLIRWDARFEGGVASSDGQPLGKRGRVGEELLWVVVADKFEEGEAIAGEGLDAIEVGLPLR